MTRTEIEALPVRQEIAAIGADMAQRLRENMADGLDTAEGEYAMGDSDVCISIDPTGADVTIYSDMGQPRSLPNIEQALRLQLPAYGDIEAELRDEDADTEDLRRHYRSLCQSCGWPVDW